MRRVAWCIRRAGYTHCSRKLGGNTHGPLSNVHFFGTKHFPERLGHLALPLQDRLTYGRPGAPGGWPGGGAWCMSRMDSAPILGMLPRFALRPAHGDPATPAVKS